MKKQIIEALQTKFPGVQASFLDRVAARIATTVKSEEEVKTAVDGVSFQTVLETYGDSRATQASETAVRNYETKYNIHDGRPIAGGEKDKNPQPAPDPNEPPAWAKQLEERLKKMETAKVSDTRRGQLQAITARLPEPLRKPYERIAVETLTDEQFQALTAELTTEVEGLETEITQRGAIFGKPTRGETPNKEQLTPEQEAAIARRDGAAAREGQPF